MDFMICVSPLRRPDRPVLLLPLRCGWTCVSKDERGYQGKSTKTKDGGRDELGQICRNGSISASYEECSV